MDENKDKQEKEAKHAELIIPGERRTYPRIALSTIVKYSIVKQGEEVNEEQYDNLLDEGIKNLNSNNVKESETVNLSSGGLLMNTDEKINPGSFICVTMHLPLPGLACNCSILGKVIRCEEVGKNNYKIAIKFEKIVHHNLNKYRYATLKEILNIEGPKIKLD